MNNLVAQKINTFDRFIPLTDLWWRILLHYCIYWGLLHRKCFTVLQQIYSFNRNTIPVRLPFVTYEINVLVTDSEKKLTCFALVFHLSADEIHFSFNQHSFKCMVIYTVAMKHILFDYINL